MTQRVGKEEVVHFFTQNKFFLLHLDQSGSSSVFNNFLVNKSMIFWKLREKQTCSYNEMIQDRKEKDERGVFLHPCNAYDDDNNNGSTTLTFAKVDSIITFTGITSTLNLQRVECTLLAR